MGATDIVALPEIVPALEAALMTTDPATRRPFTTVYAWAASQDDRITFAGRGLAYGVTLPGMKLRAVVRHNRHGGLFAPLTSDLFWGRTRAPHEMRLARALAAHGIPTPRVLAYVRYRAGGGFARVDLLTELVPNARDLSHVLTQDDPVEREEALAATARLVGSLSAAGARHADLNVKNVLLAFGAEEPKAYVLDVDRVTMGVRPARALELNLARLCRSARKWRDRLGAKVTDTDFALLRRLAAEQFERAQPPSTRS